jgi:autotransporter-associated beta strand protein
MLGGGNAGIINQTGGTIHMGRDAHLYAGSDDAGHSGNALLNITGGSFVMGSTNTVGWAMLLENAVLNVSGTGVLDLQGTDVVKDRLITGLYAGQTAIVNLGKVNAGTGGGGGGIINNAYFVKPYQGSGIFNFHGGVIVAAEVVPDGVRDIPGLVADSFMDGLTHAYIYPEGAKVSVEAGHTSMTAQVFEDPAGKGVSSASITVSNGGSGYISTPMVTITGGGADAFGATANAVVDASGHVTGIVITNPGVNYTEAPVITITGGGGIDAAVTVEPSLFVQNAGGAFEKLGAGELTLTGALSRTGGTIVDDGTLNVTLGINTPNATVYVATGGTLNTPTIVADTLIIGGAPLTPSAATVPEPGTLAMLILAAMGMAGLAWLKRK